MRDIILTNVFLHIISAAMQGLQNMVCVFLQIPLEKPEPSEEMIQPKSEYLDDQESVEDLTHLDDDMNDELEQDNSRAGPSHDPSQHPGKIAMKILHSNFCIFYIFSLSNRFFTLF